MCKVTEIANSPLPYCVIKVSLYVCRISFKQEEISHVMRLQFFMKFSLNPNMNVAEKLYILSFRKKP